MSTNSIAFPSLADPTRHGYVLQKDWEKYYDAVRRCGSAHFVSDKAGIYDTYGDGLVQHSPDVPVPYDRLADYCLSLTRYLLDRPQHQEFAAQTLARCFKDYPKWRELISFFAAMRYDEKRPYRYFCVDHDSFCKISAAESKRHDKRWSAIPTEADGSVEFVWGQLCLCTPGCCDGALRAFCSRVQFTDLCRQLDIWVGVSPAVHCKLAPNDDPGESQHVASSVAALEQIIISAVAQRRASELFDATLHNLAIRKASAA